MESDDGYTGQEEDKVELRSSYREALSVNSSFARSEITERQKSFTHSSSEITWKYANFEGGTQEDNIDCKVKKKWTISRILGEDKGINIRSQIVNPNISFSNQVFEVTFKATLHGTSNLWVFTRFNADENILENSKSPVVVINKQECLYQLPCSRVKCMVGNIKSNKKFQYIKRQDICKIGRDAAKSKPSTSQDNLAFSEEHMLEDSLEIKFTIRDSGDMGMEIIFYNNKDEVASSLVFYHTNEFNTEGQMLIAGSGNSVYIKDIRIKRREKIQMGHDVDNRSYDCCNIF
ncbi:unnamed protein product [Moneuplotes crassus]|uniref:Uncharacterized protein n=2 Tax=Euplotes crassus TaxID=5936 RepID=A0AAD1XRF2_EUPCR|nr:unnamed protein product [Moneuplotes crassus]